MTVEFNPRDHVVLVSGLMNGQVCYWDLRTGENPISTSHEYVSHRYDSFDEKKLRRVITKIDEKVIKYLEKAK